MRSWHRVVFSLALILSVAAAPGSPTLGPSGLFAQTGTPLTTQAIATRALPATVTIVTYDAAGDTLGFGSGFLVRPSGVIVTNYHVMAGAARATVILTSGERYERVEALDHDADADLAIIKIPGYGLPVLAATATLPPVGAKLVAVGNPLGLTRTVTEGIVSAVRLVEGRQLVQMSAAISPGSSGGPVLNDRGEVVAVATSYLERGQNLNFAVPMRYAMGLVDAGRRPVPLAAVFGDAGPSADPPAPTRAAAPEAGRRAARPPRTNQPRRAITGTWSVRERIVGSSGYGVDFTGFLFLGEHDLGMLAIVPEDTKNREVVVMPVQRHNAAPDGRLTLTAGGATLDGYQTDEGFYAEGEDSTDDGTFRVTLSATPGEIRLSSANGLYDVTGNTEMHIRGRERIGFADWTGEAVVVLSNDSVYVDLFLTNDAGGTAVTTMSGPLRDGRFDLRRDGDRLHGWAEGGRLRVEWVDQRDWGYYEGTLVGRRK